MAKKILVVEDDTFLMDVYKIKLASQTDWEIVTAADGEIAIRKAEELKPDLIILDLMLPKKSGLDTLKALKQNADTQKIPVVIASNMNQKETVDEVTKLGAVDYFIKSNISIFDLIEKCRQYIK